MTQNEFWDVFQNRDIVVQTDTRERVKTFYAAASSHGLRIGATDYRPTDFPWSVCYGGTVTGWTGEGFLEMQRADHITFDDWMAIEEGNGDSDIPCVSLEDVL